MNRVNVQKKRKRNSLRTAIIIGFATNVVIYIVIYAFNYFYKLEPLLEGLNTEVKILSKKEMESDRILHRIEGQYLFRDKSGQPCVVGVNPNLEEGYASAYKDNSLKISNGDRISLIRNDGIHAPSVVTITVIIIEKPQNAPISDAEFFIDKTSVEMLGYNYQEVKKMGLLRNLKFKRFPNNIGQ
jgi:hypothetical protein